MAGINNNLYPPIVETYTPAFIYTGNCKVHFKISQYNSLDELHQNSNNIVDLIQVTVTDQNTNISVLNTTQYPSGIKLVSLQEDTDGYFIIISPNDIQGGGFILNKNYKVQLRFTSKDAANLPANSNSTGINSWLTENLKYFSEWSSITLIRGISSPIVTIDNFTAAIIPRKHIVINGQVSFANNNDNETLRSYRIKLYRNEQNNKELLQDSGDIISLNNKIFYTIQKNLVEQQKYKIIISIVTFNYYTVANAKEYAFKIGQDLSPFPQISVQYVENNPKGCIELHILNNENATPSQPAEVNILIRRTSSKVNFDKWEDLTSIRVNLNNFQKILWHDYTVQPGTWYKYNFIKCDLTGSFLTVYDDNNMSMLNTEDIFLSAGDRQLKIRFDPQISNFQTKISESVVETIGSQYPFIRRNGIIKYRTFSLSGTITAFMDIDVNTFKASKKNIYKQAYGLYSVYNQNNNINLFNDSIYERYFREQVINFLQQDNIKLFRSLTEGSMLVKISNVSLSPNEVLGRHIYSFSCNVYEVADASTIKNINDYNIMSNDNIITYKE